MQSTYTKVALATALLTTAAFAPAQDKSASISDGIVKIGVLTDMSGVSADNSGRGSVAAAELAIEDFAKDKKVLGMPIELISADHQGKTDIGANLAREWFDTRQVDMITDLTFSNVALAVQKIADDKGRLALVTGAGSAAITNEQCNKSTVHWMYDTYALATGTARALGAQGLKSWFFITADYAFGHALEKDARAIVEAQGGQALGSVKHPVGTSDMSSYLLQAQNSKAQVIGLANSGADTLNTVKQAREFGLGVGANKQVFTPLLALITEVNGMGLQNAQGMFITTGFYWDQDEQTRAFSRRYFERMKKMPSMVQAGVYSSVWNYLLAIERAGSDDAQAVMNALNSVEIDDGLFKGRIRDDGKFAHDMLLMQVKAPAESSEPWDYYHVRGVIPAEQAALPLSQSKCRLVKR